MHFCNGGEVRAQSAEEDLQEHADIKTERERIHKQINQIRI
jgi:hypothetical protein